MRYLCTLIFLGIFFFNPAFVNAGAAVAAQRQKAARQEQLLKERQLLQQKAGAQAQSRVNGAIAQHNQILSAQTQTNRVSLDEFWRALDHSSKPWLQIVNPQDKVMVVQHYISEYAKLNTKIRKDPAHYAAMIDGMAQNSPGLLRDSFDKVLQAVAVMEYDFDNGWNRDNQARQLLGEEGYVNNKKRLGLK